MGGFRADRTVQVRWDRVEAERQDGEYGSVAGRSGVDRVQTVQGRSAWCLRVSDWGRAGWGRMNGVRQTRQSQSRLRIHLIAGTLSARLNLEARAVGHHRHKESIDLAAPLSELEAAVSELPIEDQPRLVERLTQRIRATLVTESDLDDQLREMAADAEIQKELREIGREFAVAEADGLDRA